MARRCLTAVLVLIAGLGAADVARGAIADVRVGPIEVREDEAFSGVVATFTDDAFEPERYTAEIHWGDGTASAGTVACRSCPAGAPSQFEVRGTHTWADPGAYVVRVVITHDANQDQAEGRGGARVLARQQQ